MPADMNTNLIHPHDINLAAASSHAIDGNALGWRKPWEDLEPEVQAAIIEGDRRRSLAVRCANGVGEFWRGFGPGFEQAECMAVRDIDGNVIEG